MTAVNWPEAIKPLLKKYKNQKHPLDYKNNYQLLVMVVLSARDSDKNINNIAPDLFKAFPTMEALSKSTPKQLQKHISKVRSFGVKSNWLIGIAKEIKKDNAIPFEIEDLIALPGIGRKSANVIRREAKKTPEGVIVDLHVVRVAPRLGISKGTDPKKIEAQIMEILPKSQWDAGMAMSFHGREICRPKPLCEMCFMRNVCQYYQEVLKGKPPVNTVLAKKK
jgi:endonuclease-3